MDDQPPTQDERALRTLRRLVTVLTLVMIGGIITITVLLAIRLNTPVAVPAAIPETLAVPEGKQIVSTRRMTDSITVLTEDGTLIILNPDGTEVLYIIPRDMVEQLKPDGAE